MCSYNSPGVVGLFFLGSQTISSIIADCIVFDLLSDEIMYSNIEFNS